MHLQDVARRVVYGAEQHQVQAAVLEVLPWRRTDSQPVLFAQLLGHMRVVEAVVHRCHQADDLVPRGDQASW
jgi:hypothetical protein